MTGDTTGKQPAVAVGAPAARGGSPDRLGFALDDESWFAQLRTFRTERRRAHLGTYEVLGEAGRGGQGVVYRARQPGTGRVVALKRMSVAGAGSSAFAARIEREAQLAAALNHPNIVAIHGLESLAGQSVLVMEWVDGVPIDRWAAGSGKAATETASEKPQPENERREAARRGTRAVLDVYLLICDAIQHAHQRGVIHRDLKPSNILVDSHDHPHVLDFGIGKLFAAEGPAPTLTRTGQFLGTPAYAAPEQFRGGPGDVDTRTDVYALGAILHELLTGRAPLTDLGFRAAPRHRRERVAAPAGVSRARLPAEVRAILLKALSADKDERYASVEALAADVRRFLTAMPVLAYSSAATYRARKFAQRNVLLCASAGLVGMVIVGLAVRATLLSFELSREAQDARDAAAREHAARVQSDELARASRDFGAQAARQAAQNQAATEFLTGLLSTPPKSADGTAAALPTAVLEKAAQLLDGGALRDQPELEQRLRFQIGKAYHDTRQFGPAAVQFEAAVAAARRAFGNDHGATSLSLGYLGVAQRHLRRLDAAEASLREAIDIADRVVPGGAGASWLAELADTVLLRGNYVDADRFGQRSAQQFADSERHSDAARAWYRVALNRKDPNNPNPDWTAAEAAAHSALASWSESGAAPNALHGSILGVLGQARVAHGDFEAGIQFFELSIATFRITGTAAQVSWLNYQLGLALQLAGRPAEALPVFRESLDQFQQFWPDERGTSRLRLRQLRLGVSLLAAGDEAAAREMFVTALSQDPKAGASSASLTARVEALVSALRATAFRVDNNATLTEHLGDLAPLDTPPIGKMPASAPLDDGAASASDDSEVREPG